MRVWASGKRETYVSAPACVGSLLGLVDDAGAYGARDHLYAIGGAEFFADA
jgi:hypothetical protein